MKIIKNTYGLLNAKDLKALKHKNIIVYNEIDFRSDGRHTLWLNITRKKTNKIVIVLNDRKRDPDISFFKEINANFDNTLDFYLIFSTNKYINYLTENDELYDEDKLSKEQIKKLLKKYKLEDSKENIEAIYNKKWTFFDLKFNLNKNNNGHGIGFCL